MAMEVRRKPDSEVERKLGGFDNAETPRRGIYHICFLLVFTLRPCASAFCITVSIILVATRTQRSACRTDIRPPAQSIATAPFAAGR